MDLEDIRRIFQRIAHYHDADDSEPIIFIWHGGEPFLVPLEIYEAIGQIQKEIFRGKREILNGVQTNLTILTDRHIDILKSGKFLPDSAFRSIRTGTSVWICVVNCVQISSSTTCKS
jgi:uncharacterized protein